jgi:precorrin-2 dehydrogenase / sirohydrochlorin ferrochelatase
MSLFPIFVKLDGRLVVVVGGGVIAEGKIAGLLASGARVRVVAPEISANIADWREIQKIEWNAKEFEASDLDGVFVVIAATSAPGVNEAVFREAEARGILCNAVDDVEHCHFYYGSVVRRGDLQIAISTNGKSPALSQRLRQELEEQFGPEYELWLEWLGAARELVRAKDGGVQSKRAILHDLASGTSFERFRKALERQAAERGAA